MIPDAKTKTETTPAPSCLPVCQSPSAGLQAGGGGAVFSEEHNHDPNANF
jgi:hypothetical protein